MNVFEEIRTNEGEEPCQASHTLVRWSSAPATCARFEHVRPVWMSPSLTYSLVFAIVADAGVAGSYAL